MSNHDILILKNFAFVKGHDYRLSLFPLQCSANVFQVLKTALTNPWPLVNTHHVTTAHSFSNVTVHQVEQLLAIQGYTTILSRVCATT